MDLELTDEQKSLKEMIKNFADREVAPLAGEVDSVGLFPRETFLKLAGLGLTGLTIPEEFGGSGAGYTESCIVGEELARVCVSTAASWGAHLDLCANNINRNGTMDQKARYLPDLASFRKIGGLAMTEPGAGSDVMAMNLRAEKKGGYYILNGAKTFITNGPVGDVFVVYAKTDPDRGSKGISAFIVEKSMPGFSRGKEFEKMGWRGSPTGELIFEDCRVPAENLLGKENEGVRVLMSGLNSERVQLAAVSLGLARGAYEAALKYARERVQFGGPIAGFQMIQERLAWMSTALEAAKLMTHRCARMLDRGLVSRITKEAAATKLFCSEAAMRITTEAVQIHGGYGYVREFPVERMMRDAKILTIGGGTSQIMCHVIAREVLA